MSATSKLVLIATGWYNYIVAKPEDQALIAQRLNICDSCPSKQQLSATGELIVQTINKAGSLYKCSACGCPLAAKTADPNGKCPLSKW